jgi:hypothetical protein
MLKKSPHTRGLAAMSMHCFMATVVKINVLNKNRMLDNVQKKITVLIYQYLKPLDHISKLTFSRLLCTKKSLFQQILLIHKVSTHLTPL